MINNNLNNNNINNNLKQHQDEEQNQNNNISINSNNNFNINNNENSISKEVEIKINKKDNSLKFFTTMKKIILSTTSGILSLYIGNEILKKIKYYKNNYEKNKQKREENKTNNKEVEKNTSSPILEHQIPIPQNKLETKLETNSSQDKDPKTVLPKNSKKKSIEKIRFSDPKDFYNFLIKRDKFKENLDRISKLLSEKTTVTKGIAKNLYFKEGCDQYYEYEKEVEIFSEEDTYMSILQLNSLEGIFNEVDINEEEEDIFENFPDYKSINFNGDEIGLLEISSDYDTYNNFFKILQEKKVEMKNIMKHILSLEKKGKGNIMRCKRIYYEVIDGEYYVFSKSLQAIQLDYNDFLKIKKYNKTILELCQLIHQTFFIKCIFGINEKFLGTKTGDLNPLPLK